MAAELFQKERRIKTLLKVTCFQVIADANCKDG